MRTICRYEDGESFEVWDDNFDFHMIVRTQKGEGLNLDYEDDVEGLINLAFDLWYLSETADTITETLQMILDYSYVNAFIEVFDNEEGEES